ncbi:MAG: hypothetical protein IMY76_06810 [Chloroflexi bacterium]|nr:hypothetical protein [Chloroflexota bacterium]
MNDQLFFLIVTGIAFLAGAAISSFVANLRKSPTSKENPNEPALEPIPKTPQYPHDAVHIWQDEQSQEVVLQIGPRSFSSGEKPALKDQNIIRALLVYLQRWLDAPEPIGPDLPVSDSDSKLENPEDLYFDQGDSGEVETYEDVSIVEQINNILQEKLAASSQKNMSVMLMELPNHGVVVMVGADQYTDVDSIPDPEIKAIIQAAVSEWENQA